MIDGGVFCVNVVQLLFKMKLYIFSVLFINFFTSVNFNDNYSSF